MLQLLVAFSLYRFEAHWIWWAFFSIVLAGDLYEKNRTK